MKKMIITLCLLGLPAVALAGEAWMETFNGAGGGTDKDGACNGAHTVAQAASLPACILKGGTRGEQKFGECACNCQMVANAQVCSCTTVLTVACTPPATGPAPAPTK
jgi:hypothetical protein